MILPGRCVRILFLLSFSFLFSISGFCQSDTSFWFAAPAITPGHSDTPIVFRLSSYAKPADITISQPANPSFQPYSIHLNQFSATTIDLTSQLASIENKPANTVLNYGIKISATEKISAYYEVVGKRGTNYNNPEIFSLKGGISKGLNFLIPGQTRFPNGGYTPQPKNGFVIVATEDNTVVDISLTNLDVAGHKANEPFPITLNRGQSYAVVAAGILGSQHLAGSSVKANKPICITIYDDSIGPVTGCRDLIGDQIIPENSNGTEFIIIRGALVIAGSTGDYYYILATTDNTTITVNGRLVTTIRRGEIYEGVLTDPSAYIVTGNPVYVYQLTGTGCEMASTSLPNIRCTGSQLVSFVRSAPTAFYLNILCKNTEVNNFLLNSQAGIITPNLFDTVAGTNGLWRAARISNINLSNIDNLIPTNANTVVSNTSGLFHLGFLNGSGSSGNVLGYFSNYGLITLSPGITSTQCVGTDIQLSSTLISNTTYQWTGPNGFSSTLYNPVIPKPAVTHSGTYYVTANQQGCGSFTDSVIVTVNPTPTAVLTGSDSICYGSSKILSLQLTGKSPWTVVYSNGRNNDTLKNISSSPYSLQVSPITTTKYSIKSITDANTCFLGPVNSPTDTAVLVAVKPLPNAMISGNGTICLVPGKTIDVNLSGRSPWQIIYSFAGKKDTVKQVNQPLYSLSFASSAGGIFTLLSVTDGSGCINDTLKQSAVVYPQPIASFSVSSELCLRDTTQLTDKSDGKGNAITKWRWNFSGGKTDTLQNPSYVFTDSGRKSIQLYVYTDKGCGSDTMTQQVTINSLPVAAFKLSSPLCESRAISFTDQSTTNVGTITRWKWNFADGTQKDTSNGNTFQKIFGAWSTYPVRLLVETNKGCKSDTSVQNVKINPLPQPGFILPEVCLDDASAQFTDTTKIADGSQLQNTYLWNFNVGTPAVSPGPNKLQSVEKNPSVKYNKAAYYKVSLTVTSKDGCAVTLTQQFTVNGSKPKSVFEVQKSGSLCSNDSVRIKNMSGVDFGLVTRLEIYWDVVGAPALLFTDDNPVPDKLYAFKYPDFQSPASRDYTIKLVAYSGTSSLCSNASSQIITINRSPKVFFVTMPGICNEAVARQITQTGFDSRVPGTFAYMGKGVNATGLFEPQVTGTGTFPIKYLYTSDKGCQDSVTMPVTVWPSPVAKWTISNPVCEKNSTLLTDSSLANFSRIVQRKWEYGDGSSTIRTNADKFFYTYDSAGIYQIRLQVITDSGCTSLWNTQAIKVNYLPKIDFTLPGICLPDGLGQFNSLASIKDVSESLFSYLWNFGDANDPSPSTLKNPIHKYVALGPYTVKLKVTTKEGCIDSLARQLTTVYPQPKAKFSATPDTICLSDMIRFQDLGNGGSGPAVKWVWDLANGNGSALQNPTKQFIDSGVFTIRYYFFNDKGCASDTALKEVTVFPYPHLTLGPNLVMLEGGALTLKPKFYFGQFLQFKWTPSSYLSSDTAVNPKASPADDITYKLTLTGAGGCAVSDTIFIKVLKQPEVPNAFSPNGDGINDTWKIKYLDSYPSASIEVYNRYGQAVFSSVGYTVEWDGMLNDKPLPVGVYYYIINPKNGRQLISGSVTLIK